jgi:predicted MFS family arabinose efflux permease
LTEHPAFLQKRLSPRRHNTCALPAKTWAAHIVPAHVGILMDTQDLAAEAHAIASPWSAVIAVAVGAFALVTSEFLPVGLLPQIAHDLQITEGQSGLMVTLPGIVAAVAALMTSITFGRIDRRHLLTGLLAVLAASNALVAVTTNVTMLLAGRALIGAAIGAFWSVGVSMGPRLRPGADGIRAASMILSGVSIGTVAGVPAGALLGHLMGWRWAFGAAAVMAVVVLGALALWLPPVKPDAGRGAKAVLALLKIPSLRMGLLTTLAMFIGQFGTYTYITPFLIRVAHVSTQHISGVLLGYGAASFVGNLIGGWGSGKNVRATVMATAMVMGGAVVFLAMAGDQFEIAIACVMAWGLGFGMMPISLQSWVFEAAPASMDNTGSLFVATAQVAIASGSLAGGLIVDRFGLITTMWLGGALAIAAGIAIMPVVLKSTAASRLTPALRQGH